MNPGANENGSLSLGRNGVRLACLDYGGVGPPVVLLHGLAGTAREWQTTAAWLIESHRVLALDQRGHGRSERRPESVTADDLVADVVAAVEGLRLGRVSLVGQSFGGQTAFLVAARHPEIVEALVVAEASPAATPPKAVGNLRDWLESWPVPFPARDDALAFFGGESVAAGAWAAGLEERQGGWWPAFDVDVVVATLAAGAGRDYWDEWAQIEATTLVVRAERGWLTGADARQMVARLPSARLVEIPNAGHDVHLEAAAEWRAVVESFLSTAPVNTVRQ